MSSIKESVVSNWGPGLNKNRNRHGGNASAGGFPDTTHLQSRPPKPWPRSGQTGDPNQAPTMMASRMMQQTSTQDDIEDWMGDPEDSEDVGWTFDPPTQFPSYFSDYQRVSHHWMEENSLHELFGLKTRNPKKIYLNLDKMRNKYQERARDALKKALVHKKFKEKLIQQGGLSDRHIPMVEKYEDEALDALKPLHDEIGDHLEFLRAYREDLEEHMAYPSILSFYEDMKNKVEQALSSIRQATKMETMTESKIRDFIRKYILETQQDEEVDEASVVGGIAGHIGPLGSDNRSPHLKGKKKKKKQYEPSMRSFGGASEVDE